MSNTSGNAGETYFQRKVRKLTNKAKRAYRVWILRDPFPTEVRRWFADKGDETLRLDYDLNEASVVFDVGGYQGDFADKISNRYNCHVFVFEPSKDFYDACVERFEKNDKVRCFNFGLGHLNETVSLSDAADASSTKLGPPEDASTSVSIRIFSEVVRELEIKHIDLIKINIEGGEFDLLPHMMSDPMITEIDNIQVQFHTFIKDAKKMRRAILKKLSETHKCDWCYTFVWENWSR